MSKTGRVEKTVDAHHGAVLCARWSYDGTSLLTGNSFMKYTNGGCILSQLCFEHTIFQLEKMER